AMSGAEVGQEDGVDGARAKSGPFEKPCRQRLRGKAGVYYDMTLAGADQRRGGMGGADGLRLVPETIARERSDADDVEANRGHKARVWAVDGKEKRAERFAKT